jgi:hypothetical protein
MGGSGISLVVESKLVKRHSDVALQAVRQLVTGEATRHTLHSAYHEATCTIDVE